MGTFAPRAALGALLAAAGIAMGACSAPPSESDASSHDAADAGSRTDAVDSMFTDGPQTDAPPDATMTSDAGLDGAPDVAADAPLEAAADVAADVALDAATDVALDATADAPGDAAADAPADVGTDAATVGRTCSLGRVVALGNARGTPSLTSDGTETLVLWNDVQPSTSVMHVRGLGPSGGPDVDLDLYNSYIYPWTPWAQWDTALRVTAPGSADLQLRSYARDGTPLTGVVSVPPQGTVCNPPQLFAGASSQLMLWFTRASSCNTVHVAVVTAGAATPSTTSLTPGYVPISSAWDGSGWVLAWPTQRGIANTVEFVRVASDGSFGAQHQTTPVAFNAAKRIELAPSAAGVMAAVVAGSSLRVGPVSAGLDIPSATLRVVATGLSEPPNALQLVRGRTGYGLLWANYLTFHFVTLDESGAPTSAVLDVTRPDLVTIAGTTDVPMQLFEGPEGWWVSWTALQSGVAVMGASVGQITCADGDAG